MLMLKNMIVKIFTIKKFQVAGFFILIFIVLQLVACTISKKDSNDNNNRIKPYHNNPAYWQYKGKPVLLLGGSKDDNLFQNTDINNHLDSLVSVGGNYVRCTMSSRDSGDEYPYFKDSVSGKFDLNRWNEKYWQRLTAFLKATKKQFMRLFIMYGECYQELSIRN